MTTKIKHTGRASSISSGIAVAASASMVTTIVLSGIIAGFLNNEKITWAQAGYWIMGMLYLASFIGSKFAISTIKRQRIVVSIMSGALYWGLLLCITALLFGGNFGAVWVTFGIIVAGSGSAAILSMPTGQKYGKKQGRVYR